MKTCFSFAISQQQKKKLEEKFCFTKNEEYPVWIYDGDVDHVFSSLNCSIEALVPYKEINSYQEETYSDLKSPIITKKFSDESTSEVLDILSGEFEKIDLKNTFDDFTYYLLLVSSELIRNAIIVNMKQSLALDCELDVYESRDDIWIKVTDHHGLFSSDELIKRIKFVAKEKTFLRNEYGAGLGLYMVLKSVNLFRLSLVKGERTQILVKIHKYKRLKDFKSKQVTLVIERGS
ncbi:MAG: hypothetical protein QF441_05045 [Bacteriovoracaceae bacterium]|jgi:anti-sigma regulatory factor (Ser/Thr protein kinase)|nr:hypothetical protein [Halobacteriovoraceae bacterium]MDP7319950.1 hypothetical protein [Bacteriovoracaceae bacterium]